MTPTIYDVAERAGVSISTVSLALNTPDRVKGATLDRILEAIDHLGFVPKTEAVLRARRGVGRIGVIAPFTSFPTAFARRLNGVFEATQSHGYEVIVFDQPSAASSRLATLPLTRRVDGLVILSLPLDDDVALRLEEQAVRTVAVEIQHESLSNVVIDHRDGGRQVGEHALARGHRHVAYVGHRQDHDYQSQSRLQLEGFVDALDTAPSVLEIEYGFDQAVAAGRELLDRPDRPTLLFGHDDLLASGLLHAARQLDLDVPGDVAVVGFNDDAIATPLGLTTVRQPFEESGRVATELLLSMLDDGAQTRRDIHLDVELVVRSTS